MTTLENRTLIKIYHQKGMEPLYNERKAMFLVINGHDGRHKKRFQKTFTNHKSTTGQKK